MPFRDDYRPDPKLPELGDAFYDFVTPAVFPRLELRFRNDRWATRVGLDELDGREWLEHFGLLQPLPSNLEQPHCMRYHGYQFRAYNPALGDGRGFTHAQLRDDRGRLLDLGTKGSGPTPYSRGGDGRLTLKGAVREILATEMLESRGVYTSKTFSVIETGERLHRGDEPSPTRSAVLVRLGHSHIRFGTFERHAAEKRPDRLRMLADHCIEHYYPDLTEWEAPNRYHALFRRIAERTIDLCASWMVAGFVHGVLNTDNMNVCGESFDYGPWRFVPSYDPMFTAAYFDHGGLYAFGRQPEAIAWNLMRLAEAFAPLVPLETNAAWLEAEIRDHLTESMVRHFFARLGLVPRGNSADVELLDDAFEFLQESRMGYDQFFHDWYGGSASHERARRSPAASTYASPSFTPLAGRLEQHAPVSTASRDLTRESFAADRPVSLLIDEVEAIWQRIDADDDWSALHRKVDAIRAATPHRVQPEPA